MLFWLTEHTQLWFTIRDLSFEGIKTVEDFKEICLNCKELTNSETKKAWY